MALVVLTMGMTTQKHGMIMLTVAVTLPAVVEGQTQTDLLVSTIRVNRRIDDEGR